MTNANSFKTLVITPTFNERENLEAFVEGVFSICPQVEILIVDDNSPDGTGQIADQLVERDSRVHVLHRPSKLGLGTAYLAGFAWALERGFDAVFEMDADGSHLPRYMPEFFSALQQGADVVLGSRNIPGGGIRGWGPFRYFLSKGGSLYARWILGVKVRDLTSGYKLFRRTVLETIELATVESTGYSFQIELTWRALRAGMKVREVPIVFEDRTQGKSKMSSGIFLEAVFAVWRFRWRGWRP
ncbi:MAG: polyprenol monophosphomannose synthase [Polyangiaceae bacterium]|nr:polyprenol monophosphomannose synthase [Polyangiaceae bacterium]